MTCFCPLVCNFCVASQAIQKPWETICVISVLHSVSSHYLRFKPSVIHSTRCSFLLCQQLFARCQNMATYKHILHILFYCFNFTHSLLMPLLVYGIRSTPCRCPDQPVAATSAATNPLLAFHPCALANVIFLGMHKQAKGTSKKDCF